jgi:hypothetical protein
MSGSPVIPIAPCRVGNTAIVAGDPKLSADRSAKAFPHVSATAVSQSAGKHARCRVVAALLVALQPAARIARRAISAAASMLYPSGRVLTSWSRSRVKSSTVSLSTFTCRIPPPTKTERSLTRVEGGEVLCELSDGEHRLVSLMN